MIFISFCLLFLFFFFFSIILILVCYFVFRRMFSDYLILFATFWVLLPYWSHFYYLTLNFISGLSWNFEKIYCLLTGETVTGELSKLLDEIKLCQEKDYSFEDLCHTISDHYLDNLSKISEEELGKNGSQSVVSKGGKQTMRLSLPVQCVPKRHGICAVPYLQILPVWNVKLPIAPSLMFTGILFSLHV